MPCFPLLFSDSCSVPKLMRSIIHSCFGDYTFNTEDKTRWNRPGWIPLNDPMMWQNISHLLNVCPKPWRYENRDSLDSSLTRTRRNLYGGGGYAAQLGYDQMTASKVRIVMQFSLYIKEQVTHRIKIIELKCNSPN